MTEQAADKGHNFGWLLLWLFVGVTVSYAAAWIIAVAIGRLTRSRRHQRDYSSRL